MFKRKHRMQFEKLDVRRVLPLRNEQQFSRLSSSLVLPTTVWFTPEVIISDALGVISDVLWFWKVFKHGVPVFAFRVAILSALFFLVVGSYQRPHYAVANVAIASEKKTVVVEPDFAIIGRVKASKVAPKPAVAAVVSYAAAAPVGTPAPVYSGPTGSIVWPVPRTGLSTYFSYFHPGIDLPAAYGTPVRPYTNGVVTLAGWDGGFGYSIIISHANGYSSRYAHLSSVNVAKGQKVTTRTTIGRVGSSGVATGPHLHFEIHRNGVAVNPLSILP